MGQKISVSLNINTGITHYLASMKRSVLIVEDDEAVSIVMRKNIEKPGHSVYSCVTTGEDAIEAVRTGECDLVVMDIKLHGSMSGIDAMQEIRKFSKIPVIYTAGNFDPVLNSKAAETKPVSYLVNPADIELFQESIDKA